MKIIFLLIIPLLFLGCINTPNQSKAVGCWASNSLAIAKIEVNSDNTFAAYTQNPQTGVYLVAYKGKWVAENETTIMMSYQLNNDVINQTASYVESTDSLVTSILIPMVGRFPETLYRC